MVDADPVAGLFRGSTVLRLQAGKRRTTRVYVEDDPADREKHQHPPEHQLSVRPLAEPARTPPAEVAHALLPAFNVHYVHDRNFLGRQWNGIWRRLLRSNRFSGPEKSTHVDSRLAEDRPQCPFRHVTGVVRDRHFPSSL